MKFSAFCDALDELARFLLPKENDPSRRRIDALLDAFLDDKEAVKAFERSFARIDYYLVAIPDLEDALADAAELLFKNLADKKTSKAIINRLRDTFTEIYNSNTLLSAVLYHAERTKRLPRKCRVAPSVEDPPLSDVMEHLDAI